MFIHCVCEVRYYNYDSTILLKNLKNNTQNTAITNVYNSLTLKHYVLIWRIYSNLLVFHSNEFSRKA